MSIRESRSSRRERWPLAFDLEGVPRDNKLRQQLLQDRFNISQEEIPMSVPNVKNSFAVDKTAGIMGLLTPEQKATLLDQLLKDVPQGREIDLSKPVTPPYRYQEFPKLVYHHEAGQVLEVHDEREQKAAEKKGFQCKPAPGRDYSKIQNAVAAVKAVGPKTEVELAQEVLAEE
jgi:hypothetical protein